MSDPLQPYRDNNIRYLESKLAEVFQGLGLSEGAARVAAGGRDGGSGLDPMPPEHVQAIDQMLARVDQIAAETPTQSRERALSGDRVMAKSADLEQELVEVFQGLGMSESAAKIAASGR